MANERTETNDVSNNQADGTQIYLSGQWRTIIMVKFNVGAGLGAVDIVDPGAASIYVVGFQFSCDTDATTFKFNDSTPADLTNAQTFMKGGGMVVFPYKTLLFKTAAGKKLQGTAVTGATTGCVWYCVF